MSMLATRRWKTVESVECWTKPVDAMVAESLLDKNGPHPSGRMILDASRRPGHHDAPLPVYPL